MKSPNRVAEFFPPGTMTAPAGRKPGGSHSLVAGDTPDLPGDLFSQLICPVRDFYRSDQRYAAIRQQLTDHYQPSDPDQLTDIDLIASDMLHLASLRHALYVSTVPSISVEAAAECRKLRQNKRVITLLARTIKAAEQQTAFACTEREAKCLSRILVGIFNGVHELVAEIDAEAQELDPDTGEHYVPDAHQKAEDDQTRQIHTLLQPIAAAAADPGQVHLVLTGRRPVSPAERGCWLVLLNMVAENARGSDKGLDKAEAKIAMAKRTAIAALAKDPIQFATLHRVATQVEEAIGARTKRLEKRLKNH